MRTGWRALGPVTAVAALLAVATAAPASQSGSEMHELVTRWMSMLDEGQRDRATMSFADEERLNFNYTPVERKGLPLGAMSAEQAALVHSLLDTGLSDSGHRQAMEIIELEVELYERSGGRAMRDPTNYFLSIFMDLSAGPVWGWRFEGHHLSLNFTLGGGQVVGTSPAFFGGNPAHVTEGERAGLRPFSVEEDLGRRLLGMFGGAARESVIVSDEAPRDILTRNAPRAEIDAPRGRALSEMSEEQAAAVRELLNHYLDRLHPNLAAAELAGIRQAGYDAVHFAWAGGSEPGQPHYYRIQGPTFVVEYDNTQNDANHVHSVWRSVGGDFGRDPLREHLAADHGLVAPADTAAAREAHGHAHR